MASRGGQVVPLHLADPVVALELISEAHLGLERAPNFSARKPDRDETARVQIHVESQSHCTGFRLWVSPLRARREQLLRNDAAKLGLKNVRDRADRRRQWLEAPEPAKSCGGEGVVGD